MGSGTIGQPTLLRGKKTKSTLLARTMLRVRRAHRVGALERVFVFLLESSAVCVV